MGTIIETRVMPDSSVRLKIEMDIEESMSLAGRYKEISVFTEEMCNSDASVKLKGRNNSVVYFEIPASIRKKPNFRQKTQRFRMLETPSKWIIICLRDKNESEALY